MPIASARSRSSVKTWRTMDSVAGIIIAAPTARNTRAAISHSAVGENAAQRRDGKHRQSGEKQPLMADAVAQHAGAGQQAGHHQRVGVDDPEFCEALASSTGLSAAGRYITPSYR